MVVEIFLQPRLGSSACVACYRVLFLETGSSSNHPHYPGQHYLQALCVESEAMGEDDWRHNFTITSDHPKHHDMDWVFGFHHYQYILLETEQSIVCSMSLPSDSGRIFSHLKKQKKNKNKQSMFGWRGCLSLLKSFAAQSFLLSFMACDKNWPFLILYEKYQMSSCTICLIRITLIFLTIDLIDLLGSLSIKAWISPTNSGVLFSNQNDQSETSKLLYFHNHH